MPDSKRGVAAAAVLMATVGVFAAGPAQAATPMDRFHHQTITWRACTTGPDDRVGKTLDAAGAQCATVLVPMDYRRPDGRTVSVAISRVKATDASRRRGVLLFNPGGPGGSGLQMPLLGKEVPEVGARYDLLGMDPRFVGRSTPISCRWRTDTYLRSAGPDRPTFDKSVRLARHLAAGCVAGNLQALPYASTRNTARDMDVIRAALGERKLSYVGYSYGTYLGATYLQMFGSRADRVVLDSAVDPQVYGPRLLSRAAPAIDAALRRWASWAASRHKEYGLGSTREAVLATVEKINRQPVTIGGYRVDSSVVALWLMGRLYDDGPQASATLAKEARALSHAGKTPPPASFQEFLDGLFTGAGEASDRAGTAILCADRAAPRDPEIYYRDIQRHRSAEPLFGPLVRNISPCAFWPVKPLEAPTTIGNSVPALIVSAEGDPATPYPGQQAMHHALTGSRMITLTGAYRHTVYIADKNTCVDTKVTCYLLDGHLPEADVTCSRPAG
ncbi:alpha/beta hydrolase [Nonomuraea sediminis]|uniref:alpha/beta hydrolase n=1 Tax=Nonomuraea sediminis TaxID=2835864 RepID=UPI001BDD8AF5|nr:alpha/beta hydrolase [Nonomuraea sediminis]